MAASVKEETGAQLFARLGHRPPLADIALPLFPGLDYGQVNELYGEEGTGKTEILCHIIVRAILPRKWKNLALSGLQSGVIYLDTDYHFCMLRLVSLLERYIKNKYEVHNNTQPTTLSEKETEDIIKQSLKRLFVARCNSTTILVATLHHITSLLNAQCNVSLVMIDSISAFYWIDRYKASENVSSVFATYSKVICAMSFLINTYNLTFFVTKQAMMHKRQKDANALKSGDSDAHFALGSNGGRVPDFFEYIGHKWEAFVTKKLVLYKTNNEENSQQLITILNSENSVVNKLIITGDGIQFL